MHPRYPIWMTVAFGAQLLLFLALAGFAVTMGSAFSGIVPAKAWLSLAPVVFTLLCFGLSIWLWRKNQPLVARLLVPAPLIAVLLIAVLASIFVPASPPQM